MSNLDHLAKVTERLMEDKNFTLQDLLSLYVADELEIEVLNRHGKSIAIDRLEFTTRLDRMIKKTSEDIREEDKEERRLA